MEVRDILNFQGEFDVSRETVDRLQAYCDLVRKWNPTINLIARSTLDDIWSRHVVDSANALRVSEQQSGHWVDLGSGGGFPGVVVAIMAAEKAPNLTFTCIESDIRKAAFLRTVAREVGVSIGVLSRRIEESPDQNAEVVSARALAPLTRLLDYATKHRSATGQCIFLKGETWQKEVDEALESWTFSVETTPSMTHPGSAILKVKDISRV